MRSLRFKVSTIKNHCRHQALYEWTIGKVQNGTSMYGSYHPTPHMKMFISMHAGSTDKHEEMTEKKKDMKVPFPFDRSALSNSRPQNSAPQFVSMRLSLSPPSTSPHKKTRIRWPDVFIPPYCFFVEMSIFPYIANSMICNVLYSALI